MTNKDTLKVNKNRYFCRIIYELIKNMEKMQVKEAKGKLGVLVVGVGGAVSTTMITGVLAARKGLAKPIGSITQMATMRVQAGEKPIKEIVPLADLSDIVFGGWDIFPDNAYEAASYAEVLKEKDLKLVKEELEAIKPMPAAFDHNWAKRLNGTHIKQAATRWEMVEQLRRAVDTCLTEQERLVIRLRYGLGTGSPLRQREVADRTGISRSYVSRIEKRALRKLRTALE